MFGKTIFIDTSYVFATINPRDQWHSIAGIWQRSVSDAGPQLFTTEFVLTEIADGLASINFRQAAKRAIDVLISNPSVEIIPVSSDLFSKALTLYESRIDKNWGLTDCSSFVVMKDHGIDDALTTDDHFRQAGFNALMLK